MISIEQQREIKREAVLKTLDAVADVIAGLLGSHCEVALHDLRDLSASIVKIVNGHVTGRRVGGGMTDYGLTMIKAENSSLFLDYSSRTPDARPLKSAGMVFRDEDGEPIAMLCINWDTTNIVNIEYLKEVLLPFAPIDLKGRPDETFQVDIGTTLHEITRKVLDNSGIPPRLMKKEDRLEVVAKLEERGFFMMKGAVSHLARRLGISKFSVYAYLEEVRSNQEEALESTQQAT